MTGSQEPESEPRNRQRRRWVSLGLLTGSILVLAGAAAIWRGWLFVNNDLSQFLSEQLSDTLNRPVQLGDIEAINLTRVRVGPSEIPATPTDPDALSLDAVEVRYNLLELLSRRLSLKIYLDGVDAYLEQSADGQWVNLDIQQPSEAGQQGEAFIKVKPSTIHLNDGMLTLVPYPSLNYPSQTIALNDIQGEVHFTDIRVDPPQTATDDLALETQQIDVNVRGSSVIGGHLDLQGSVVLPPASATDPSQNNHPQNQSPASGEIVSWWPVLPTWIDALHTLVAGSVSWAATPASPHLQAKLSLQAQEVRVTDVMPLVESFLPGDLPVKFPTGIVSGHLDASLDGVNNLALNGTAYVKDGTVEVQNLPAPIENLQGTVRFKDQHLTFEQVTATLSDLSAQAGGTLDLNQGYDLAGSFDPFTVEQVSQVFKLDLPVATEGTFNADVTMTGPLDKPVITTELAAQKAVTIDKVIFSELTAAVTVKAPDLVIDRFRAVPQAGGVLTGSGRYQFGDPGQLTLQASGDRLPADAIGRAYGLPDAVTIGPLFVDASLSGPISQLQGQANWRAPMGDYPAQGEITLANQTVRLTNTFVQVAEGTVSGEGVIANGLWDASLQARGLRLNQLSPNLNGTAAGQARLSGALTNFSLAGIQGQANATVAMAGGQVTGQADLANGLWTANVEGNQLQLRQFASNLQGTASGQFALNGNVDNLSLAGVRGQGNLVLSDGLASAAGIAPQLNAVREPLIAQLAWNGQTVNIQQASTAGIEANGTITPLLSGPTAPTIADMAIRLRVQDYSLAALPAPAFLPLQGSASFTGQINGNLDNLILMGDAQLNHLAVSDLAFASPLSGPVKFSSASDLSVDLRGGGDQISVAYGFNQRNLDFRVQADSALATGHTEGDQFEGQLTNFPIALLNLPPGGVGSIGTVRGLVEEANITANLSQPTLMVDFNIADPALGFITLRDVDDPSGAPQDEPYSRLRGKFAYADGTLSLTSTELTTASGDSRYLLTGWFNGDTDPQLRGQMTVENGKVQDVLMAAQIFELADFANFGKTPEWFKRYTPDELEAILTTQPNGNPNASLLDQLRRLSEILELEDQQAAKVSGSPLPPLAELRGTFSGDVGVSGTLPKDVDVSIDLAGQDWTWSDAYHVDQVIVKGSYADGLVKLSPVRLASNAVGGPPAASSDTTTLTTASDSATGPSSPAFASLNGEISLKDDDEVPHTMALDVENVAFDALRRPLKLPQNFDGILNGQATLTGSLDNPQVRGGIDVVKGTVNNNPVDEAGADFIYQDARFNLVSKLTVDGNNDPLKLTASIPYRLPFAKVSPRSEDLSVNLQVSNEGLTLINLFTRAVTWESGDGQINAVLTGTWPDGSPTPDWFSVNLNGIAEFKDASIRAQVLPEPLTNLEGRIRLNNDLITVEGLRGKFSDGQLLARGTFPLIVPLEQRKAPPQPDAPPASVPTGPPPRPSESGADPAASDGTDSEPNLDKQNLSPDNDLAQAAPTGPTTRPVPLPGDPNLTPSQIPLTLDMRNIDLNLKGLYNGQVNGDLQLKGSMLLGGPVLTGNIRLSDGVLSLPETSGGGTVTTGTGSTTAPTAASVRLDNLHLGLENDVRIAVVGLVDVSAEGGITVNGIFPDIRPEGRINLPSGRINLLTTEFRLTGNQNYAEFTPARGLDPYLSATLRAAVPESAGGTNSLSVATPFPRNEVDDSALNTLNLNQTGVQTIRIEAKVDGPVSQLVTLQGVELSSTPPRSDGAIITLISGGILNALESTIGSVAGGGDSFGGLIAFAGSALLNNVQDILGDALRLSDLRLYSATPQSAQNSGAALDIGGEVGFEFSPSISVSVQKVFTNLDPVFFNIRYRISDQFVLRGTTSYENFSQNTGAILEYQAPLP